MKKLSAVVIALELALLAAAPVQARNVKYVLPIAAALDSTNAKAKLNPSVKFGFGTQSGAKAEQKFATIEANAKATIIDHADIPACNAALVSALEQMQKNIVGGNANAIINITTFFHKGEMTDSATEFECHAGSFSAGVSVRGDLAKVTGN